MTARPINTLMALIMSCGLTMPFSLLASNYAITSDEFNLLPPFCQYLNEDREVPAPVGMPHALHFCHGLKYVLRANLSIGDTYKERSELETAIGEFNYVLTHTKEENSGGLYNTYLSITCIEKAKVLMRLDDSIGSLKFFQRAIRYNPKLASAYAGLSDLYLKMGMKDDARAALNLGLKQAPGSKSLQRRLNNL